MKSAYQVQAVHRFFPVIGMGQDLARQKRHPFGVDITPAIVRVTMVQLLVVVFCDESDVIRITVTGIPG